MYDYAGGKVDWASHGLPTDGELAVDPRVGDIARRDVATSAMDTPMDEVRARARASGIDACVVVNDHGVVFGLLRAEQLARTDVASAGEAMRPGPSTFRPNVSAQEMAEYMTDHDLMSSPITTNDGELVGLLLRDDAVRVAREIHERRHHGDADYPRAAREE